MTGFLPRWAVTCLLRPLRHLHTSSAGYAASLSTNYGSKHITDPEQDPVDTKRSNTSRVCCKIRCHCCLVQVNLMSGDVSGDEGGVNVRYLWSFAGFPGSLSREESSSYQGTLALVRREQDRFLPIANISRIMKRNLPGNAKIAKDAKETVQECVSEFISFITSE